MITNIIIFWKIQSIFFCQLQFFILKYKVQNSAFNYQYIQRIMAYHKNWIKVILILFFVILENEKFCQKSNSSFMKN